MPTMRAARFHGPEIGLKVEELPRPTPGPGEVLVRVGACGLCGSDVHFLEGLPVPGGVPMTLGHEPAGIVEEVGPGVEGWQPGERVAISLDNGCGECRTCRAGWREACLSLVAPGLHIDGAYAEAIVVPAVCLVRVPDDVSLAAAAVATDCVASPYHALKCRARLQAGEQVVVVGVGGLGSQAVVLAKHLGASRIVAVDRSETALQRAAAAGADAIVLSVPGEDPVPAIQAALEGGAEVAIECVGAPDAVSVAFRSLVPGGRLVVIGIGIDPPNVEMPTALFALWELSVIGSFASHREDVEELLALHSAGKIDMEACISERIGLDEVPAGLERLRTREGEPQRIVMELPV